MKDMRRVPDFPMYMATKSGDIYSCYTDKYLSQKTSKIGYKTLCIIKGGERHDIGVHRLVAMAFIENSHNKPCVNHIDGNKSNNNINNLEWCTFSENAKHAYKTGLNRRPPLQRRSVDQLSVDGDYMATYQSAVLAMRKTGANNSEIGKVCMGKADTAGGYKWRYSDGK